jgi:hypothetical protein
MVGIFLIVFGVLFAGYAILRILPRLLGHTAKLSHEGREIREYGRMLTDNERSQLGSELPKIEFESGVFRDRGKARADQANLKRQKEADLREQSEKKIRDAIKEKNEETKE